MVAKSQHSNTPILQWIDGFEDEHENEDEDEFNSKTFEWLFYKDAAPTTLKSAQIS